MRSTKITIKGVPYSHQKPRGNLAAPILWSDDVKRQTANLPKIVHPCLVRITFRLPPNKFPKDHPYGSDLDNLIKRFFDALVETVFSEAPGKDGIVVSIEAVKVKVVTESEAGADLEIIEIERSY